MPISNLGPSQRGADGRRRPDWQAQLGSNYLSPLLIGLAAAALLVVLLNSSLVRSLLALDAPFAAAPDPGLAELAEPTLSNCLFVGAPLLIGVYLLLSAITIDAIARRHFGYAGTIEGRRPLGYLLIAALVVFPQLLFAAPSAAWGLYNLAIWVESSHGHLAAAVFAGGLIAALGAIWGLTRNSGVFPRPYITP